MSSTVTTGSSKTTSKKTTNSETAGTSSTSSGKVLDEELLSQILGSLTPGLSDEAIGEYAKQLLQPSLQTALEESRNAYDTAKLSGDQEIRTLESELADAIASQQSAYRQSRSDVETGALARGMGRSSYTLSRLAAQGDALAEAVKSLTAKTDAKKEAVREQVALAGQQAQEKQALLKTNYEQSLAAKAQELKSERDKAAASNYLTAVSQAMGTKSETASQSESRSSSTTKSTSSSKSVTQRG